MINPKKTADYKIVVLSGKKTYQFFCDLSGALCAEIVPHKDADPEKELMLAWEGKAKENFNVCHKCGIWVSDVMYNPDVHNCVRCSPIEDIPEYCPKCGEKTKDSEIFCHKCKVRLMYGGEFDEDD